LGELVAARSRGCGQNSGEQSPQDEALYIDCGEKDKFNLLYRIRAAAERSLPLRIATKSPPTTIRAWTIGWTLARF
jgi:hypothetical protein